MSRTAALAVRLVLFFGLCTVLLLPMPGLVWLAVAALGVFVLLFPLPPNDSPTSRKGMEHAGEYKDGRHNGQGTYTDADGRRYTGEFRAGKFNGQGTFTNLAGDTYIGAFKDGKFNGQGTNTLSDGSAYSGIWKNGKLQPTPKVWPQSKIRLGTQ